MSLPEIRTRAGTSLHHNLSGVENELAIIRKLDRRDTRRTNKNRQKRQDGARRSQAARGRWEQNHRNLRSAAATGDAFVASNAV
jgi:hypothetical protein